MAVSKFRLVVAVAICAALGSSFAAADRDDHDHRRHWHGDIHHFHDRDYGRWRGGRWYHGYHDGRLGWWWIAADLWYLYPQPIYPYPNPYVPPVVVAPQPAPVTTVPEQPTVWYFCASAHQYYPYVSSCPEGWQQVPAQPSDAPH